jgi:hypothetical protein
MFISTTITRRQLRAYGATDYLARSLTKAIVPVGQQGRSLLYSISDVITAIDASLQRRIRPATQQRLQAIRSELTQPHADDSLERLAAEILEEHSKFEQVVAESKQKEEAFYATHDRWIQQTLVKRNNIVTFKP